MFYRYCLGSEWEGQEILDRNEKEISSAVFTKVSQCGSYSHPLIAKAISIWSEGSTIGCGGKSFVYFDCYFTNVNLGIMKLCSEQSLSSFHYNEIKPLFSFICWQALADPYFKGLAKVEREPSCQPISRSEFEFERRKLTKDDVRGLLYREILEYHPQIREDYLNGTETTKLLFPRFLYIFPFNPFNLQASFKRFCSTKYDSLLSMSVLQVILKANSPTTKRIVVKVHRFCL